MADTEFNEEWVSMRHPDIEQAQLCSPRAVKHWEKRGWTVSGTKPANKPAEKPADKPAGEPVDEPAGEPVDELAESSTKEV